MRIDDMRRNNIVLFEAISGSRAYGTNKPTSDTDIRGIYLADLNDVLGFNYQDQVNDNTNDVVFYELKRFLELIWKQNPNILEMLYMPEDCIISKHPIMNVLFNNRDKFLTKTCKDSFAGYAISQIKKARGLNKKINMPENMERLTPLDFCYFMDKGQSIPAKQYLGERGMDQRFCGLVSLDHMRFTYAVYYDKAGQLNDKHGLQIPTEARFKGIIQSEELSNSVSVSEIPKHYPHFPIGYMQYNSDAYEVHCRVYKEWAEWKQKRNADRYETTIAHGKGYDAKNMMHCIRLLRVAKEIATEGVVNVRRPDREELLKIRNGDADYDALLAEADQAIAEIDEMYAKSSLPDKLNAEFMNDLLLDMRFTAYNLTSFQAMHLMNDKIK